MYTDYQDYANFSPPMINNFPNADGNIGRASEPTATSSNVSKSVRLPEIEETPTEAPKLKKAPPKCVICEKESHGKHFGVLSCRPCAAFFRRFVCENLSYNCLRNNNKCSVLGRGRVVCRQCRYKKCVDAGMTEDNVQFGGRRKGEKGGLGIVGGVNTPAVEKSCVSRKKSHNRKSKQLTSSNDVFDRVHIHAEMLAEENAKKAADERQMDEVIGELKHLFIDVRYEQSHRRAQLYPTNELVKLNSALSIYRQNQKPANMLQFVDKICLLNDSLGYYTKLSKKFTKWISSLDFFTSLSDEDKMNVVQLSFTNFDRLERSQMTAQIFGMAAYTERKFLINSYCALNLNTFVLDPETSVKTAAAEGFVKKAFYDHANDILNKVVKPLVELELTDIETTFMLTHIVVYNAEKVPEHLIKLFDELRERVASSLHDYYAIERGIDVYSPRVLKIMAVVNSMKQIQADRLRASELINFFGIYHVSQKRNDFVCS